jgi:hypothetical protein
VLGYVHDVIADTGVFLGGRCRGFLCGLLGGCVACRLCLALLDSLVALIGGVLCRALFQDSLFGGGVGGTVEGGLVTFAEILEGFDQRKD